MLVKVASSIVLKRERAVKVGATPGVTKTLQYVKLDKQVNLVDSPGVLFSAGKEDEGLTLRNCLKAEQIADPQGVVNLIVKKCPMETLCEVYKIAQFRDADEFLLFVAQKIGKLKKGGVPNFKLTALTVIQDWNNGKIPFCSLPPKVDDIQASEIVSWAKEFGDYEKMDEESSIE